MLQVPEVEPESVEPSGSVMPARDAAVARSGRESTAETATMERVSILVD